MLTYDHFFDLLLSTVATKNLGLIRHLSATSNMFYELDFVATMQGLERLDLAADLWLPEGRKVATLNIKEIEESAEQDLARGTSLVELLHQSKSLVLQLHILTHQKN